MLGRGGCGPGRHRDADGKCVDDADDDSGDGDGGDPSKCDPGYHAEYTCVPNSRPSIY